MLIKYDVRGEVEWAKVITVQDKESFASIGNIVETSDGGLLLSGSYKGKIYLENGLTITDGNYPGMIIKYNANMKIELATRIGANYGGVGIVKIGKDGGFTVCTQIYGKEDFGNGIVAEGSVALVKFEPKEIPEVKIKKAYSIGGSSDCINSVASTSDGGYIAGGYFNSSTIDLGNGVILNNQSSSTSDTDGVIIKYDTDGGIEWAKGIGGSRNDQINSVASTSDGAI